MMSEFRRRLLIQNALKGSSGDLPSGYRKLDYIKTLKNREYKLSTGYKVTEKTSLKIKFCQLGISKSEQFNVLFSIKPNFRFGLYLSESMQPQYYTNYYQSGINLQNKVVTYEQDKNRTIVDGKVIKEFYVAPFKGEELIFFKDQRFNWASPYLKIYSIEIREDDKIFRNMIPCESDTNEVGLFDTIEQKFYGNETESVFFGNTVITDKGYVKDGLVFHLDGKNKGNDKSNWVDLISGIKFHYNDCILNEDSVQFNGQTSFAYSDTTSLNFPSTESTLEIVYSMEGTSPAVLFFPSAERMISYGYSDSIQLYSSGNPPKSVYYFKNSLGIKLVSISDEYCFDTGTYHNHNGQSTWFLKTKKYCSIGARVDDSLSLSVIFKGKIYAIRIYDRILDTIEMEHNQNIDKNYYNLLK